MDITFSAAAQRLLLYGALPLLLIGLGHLYVRVRPWFLLRRFPRVGIDPGPLGLWRARAARQEFRERGKELVREGYRQHPETAFVVQTATGARLVLPARVADETRNWSDARLSHKLALLHRFQAGYTGIDEVRRGVTHRDVVKVQLTQHLGVLLPHLTAATAVYLRDAIPREPASVTVNAYHTGLQAIAHMTSRVILDDPVARSPDWMRVLVDYTEHAARLAETLRQWAPYLRPLVHPFLHETRAVRADVAFMEATLTRIIADRRAPKPVMDKPAEHDDHVDLVRWLTELEPEASPERLVGIILFLVVAGIHTSAFTLAHALYSLCQLPDVQQQLRAEIREVLGDDLDHWTLPKFHQLRQMDSFLKENHRANPLGVFAYNRLVREDVVLSDGTRIPAGVMICAAREAYARDPALYADPHTFDARRYLGDATVASKEGTGRTLFSSTASGDSWFGLGSQACPGRWYAEVQLKVIIVLLLTRYDLSFPHGQVERPPNLEADEKILPSVTQDIILRRLDG